jgi:hypothetical protein
MVGYSPEFIDLLRQCLAIDPGNRLVVENAEDSWEAKFQNDGQADLHDWIASHHVTCRNVVYKLVTKNWHSDNNDCRQNIERYHKILSERDFRSQQSSRDRLVLVTDARLGVIRAPPE